MLPKEHFLSDVVAKALVLVKEDGAYHFEQNIFQANLSDPYANQEVCLYALSFVL
jgi:hypothetical protein